MSTLLLGGDIVVSNEEIVCLVATHVVYGLCQTVFICVCIVFNCVN